ncbi:MAG: cyanophycin synthetase, partial [Pseudomonadota bacterium]
ETVCEEAGVTYVNDSKATNTASTAPALAAYPPVSGTPRIHWIVGGLAKEDGLGECEAQLDKVAAAYTVGEAGPQFAQWLEGKVPRVEPCELISEAVRRAQEMAKPGDVVLFSPACASFDQFRDYEKRGDHFRQLVGVIAECSDDCAPAGPAQGWAR